MSILHFVGLCLFLSCVLFVEKRLKLVTMKRSERTSQSFTSFCDEVWVSEVNVHDFFESMSSSKVHINRWPIFFGMRVHRRSISTDYFLVWIHIDGWFRLIFGWNQRSIKYWPYFQVGKSLLTVDIDRILKQVYPYRPLILTVFSSSLILIERRYWPYSQVGESLSTVDVDRDRLTGRLKRNRPINDTCEINE